MIMCYACHWRAMRQCSVWCSMEFNIDSTNSNQYKNHHFCTNNIFQIIVTEMNVSRNLLSWGLGGSHVESVMSYVSKSDFHKLMHIYLKNNPPKFHPNPIWNDAALGFFEEVATTRRRRTRARRATTSWVVIWDQFRASNGFVKGHSCLTNQLAVLEAWTRVLIGGCTWITTRPLTQFLTVSNIPNRI